MRDVRAALCLQLHVHRLSKREWPSRAVLDSEIIFSRVLYEPLLSFDHGYRRAALKALGIRMLDPDTHLARAGAAQFAEQLRAAGL